MFIRWDPWAGADSPLEDGQTEAGSERVQLSFHGLPSSQRSRAGEAATITKTLFDPDGKMPWERCKSCFAWNRHWSFLPIYRLRPRGFYRSLISALVGSKIYCLCHGRLKRSVFSAIVGWRSIISVMSSLQWLVLGPIVSVTASCIEVCRLRIGRL